MQIAHEIKTTMIKGSIRVSQNNNMTISTFTFTTPYMYITFQISVSSGDYK